MIEVQSQRNRSDGAHIRSDLLTLFAVPAGGAPGQQPVLVTEGEGIAIDLEFPNHGQRRQGSFSTWFFVEHLQQAGVPAAQFFRAEGIVETEQRDAVSHAGESFGGRSSHPLSRAVCHHQLRMSSLQIKQFAVEPVVDRILKLRGIQHVIGMGRSGEQLPQFCGAFAVLIRCGFRGRRSHGRNDSALDSGDPLDFPAVLHLGEGEVERHFLLAFSDQLHGENHVPLLQARSA